MPNAAAEPDIHTAATIVRAEGRRGTLERTTLLGMEMVERVAERAKTPEVANDTSANPYKLFINLTRTVRLTLMLETRIDEKILAIRNGKFNPRGPLPAAAPVRRVATSASAKEAEAPATLTAYVEPVLNRDSVFPERNRIRDVVWEAIDREVRDPYDAHWMLDRLHVGLIDGATYDTVLDGDFRACIETICADLGLNPDWNHWSDEEGFVRGPNEHFLPWARRYSYDPETAETYARHRIERAERHRALADALTEAEPEPHPRQ